MRFLLPRLFSDRNEIGRTKDVLFRAEHQADRGRYANCYSFLCHSIPFQKTKRSFVSAKRFDHYPFARQSAFQFQPKPQKFGRFGEFPRIRSGFRTSKKALGSRSMTKKSRSKSISALKIIM